MKYPTTSFPRLARTTFLFLGALCALAVHAQVVVSNLQETLAGSRSETYLAASFTTGSGATTLDSVTIKISFIDGSPGSTASLSLYSDISGAIGTSLKSIAANVSPSVGLNTYFASGGYALAAAETYWLVFHDSGYVSGTGYQWAFTASDSETSSSAWTIGDTLRSGSGFPPAVTNSESFMFSVSTASAIPEPSTYAAILGVCALGLVAYRRHGLKKGV